MEFEVVYSEKGEELKVIHGFKFSFHEDYAMVENDGSVQIDLVERI